MNMIGIIEDDIIGRVNTAKAADVMGYLKTVKTYGGELAAIERAVRSFPAVLVVYNGDQADETRSTANTEARVYNFIAFCCGLNLRSEEATRKGAGDGVGSYQIAEDIRLLFRGFSLPNVSAEEIRVPSIRPVMNDMAGQQLVSIYAVDLQVTAYVDYTHDISGLSPFAVFHANWDIPEFRTDIQSPLPADDKADATDHVILQQTPEEEPNP